MSAVILRECKLAIFVFGLDRSEEEVKVRKQSVRRILIMCLHYDNRYGSESIACCKVYKNNK